MTAGKYSPALILSIAGIVLVILFMAVAASGFSGFLPGSFYYKNKNENGFYVFYRILEELDYRVVFENRYKILSLKNGTVVYVDINQIEESFREGMLDWTGKGNSLVLFDSSIDVFFDEEAVRYTGNISGNSEEGSLIQSDRVFNSDFLSKLKNIDIVFENSEGAVIVRTEYGKGTILLVSDRNIFNNLSLRKSENAVLLDRIFYEFRNTPLYLREKGSEVIFDATLVKGLLRGRLSLFTVHLAAVFIIFLVISGKRFSKPQNLSASKIRKISEHINAVGVFYHKAGAYEIIERTDTEYFKWVICRNRKPSVLSREEYEINKEKIDGLTEDETAERFQERNKCIKKIRSKI